MAEYIDKRKAQMALCNLPATLDAEAVQRCIETVHNLPAADVRENVKARWIEMGDHLLCSGCGATHYGADKNFCPNCGADCRGGR